MVYLIRAKVIIFFIILPWWQVLQVRVVTTCTYDSLVIMLENNSFQIHNLLELVKKEQNIYNVAFNEIIRQVSDE